VKRAEASGRGGCRPEGAAIPAVASKPAARRRGLGAGGKTQRDRVQMSSAEVAEFLAGSRKVQMATLNPDGSVHLVTMFYAMVDERIAFWTYRTSQKALNLARDPRITCLVEDGTDYFELRGVQVIGAVRCIEDLPGVLAIGRLIASGMGTGAALEEYVTHAARKRHAYIVEPRRIISWDHRKLLATQP
jgi:hypothetical protein